MTAIQIKPTPEEWLASRPNHINASELATICGVSKYGDIVALWDRKINKKTDSVENRAMLWGHVFEDGVAKIFEKETGLQVIDSSAGDWQFIRQEEPWMACSPDRTYWLEGATHNNKWSNKGLLECKTTTTDPEAEGNEWMLRSWYAQVQWQLLVAEMEDAHLCCCVFGHERKTIIKHWPADREFQAKLYAIAKKFWEDNVLQKVAPMPRTKEQVAFLFPAPAAGVTVEATDDIRAQVAELAAVKKNIKALEEQAKTLTDTIACAIGEAEGLEADGKVLATFKAQTAARLDTTRLKAEHPDIYEQYKTEATTRILRIK